MKKNLAAACVVAALCIPLGACAGTEDPKPPTSSTTFPSAPPSSARPPQTPRPTPTTPPATPTPSPTPTSSETSDPSAQTTVEETPQAVPEEVYYSNCTEVRAAGAAPIHRGEPGYSSKLDRDGDGTACDK